LAVVSYIGSCPVGNCPAGSCLLAIVSLAIVQLAVVLEPSFISVTTEAILFLLFYFVYFPVFLMKGSGKRAIRQFGIGLSGKVRNEVGGPKLQAPNAKDIGLLHPTREFDDNLTAAVAGKNIL